MAFQTPPLPSFQTNIPQMPNALDQASRAATLKGMLSEQALRQQLAPLQVQEAQEKAKQAGLASQEQQMELDSRKAMMQAIASGELNKYAGVETSDGSGFDAAGAYQHLISKGVRPEEASQYTNSWLSIGKNSAEISKNLGEAGKAQQEIREKTLKQVANKLGDIGDMKLDAATKALDSFRSDLVKNPKAYAGLTQQEMAELYSADLTHLDALEGHLGMAAMVADFHKSKSEAAAAQQKVIPEGGGLSPDTQQQIKKDVAVATNPEIQAGKEAVAKAEGQARAQVQIAMEPIRLQIQQQFANQKDARDKIETTVLKPYQEKMTDIQMARTAIAQAADNPVAARAAVFKMVGVAQPSGSHRVLPMEFAAFKYPGGIGDQVVEHFNDFLKGSPWTPEIAAAANAFIDGQASAAQSNLNSGIDNTNKLYNTDVGAGLKSKGKEAHPFFSKFGGTVR